MNPTHFWLVRHGETQWNALRKLQGWKDIPLNDVGTAQAQQLERYFASHFTPVPDTIYSSDLSRAYETAAIATKPFKLPIHTSQHLRERHYGIYEGHDWALLNAGDAERPAINFRELYQAVEGGESLAEFAQRIQSAFEVLANKHKGEKVMVFAHGGVIDIAWRLSNQIAFDAPRPSPIHNTSINHFCIHGPNAWEAISWAQTSHLAKEAKDDIM